MDLEIITMILAAAAGGATLISAQVSELLARRLKQKSKPHPDHPRPDPPTREADAP
jgi:hypothetical protein